jgi:hypothetical protein
MNTSALPTPALAPTAGLPIVNQALEPASVRNGSPAVQKAYASALGFEEMLVQQLSQSLTQGTGLGGEEGAGEGIEGASGGGSEGAAGLAGGGAVSSQLASLLPQALTEGVMRQGGLGLAKQLLGSLAPGAGAGATAPAVLAPSGGASAPGISPPAELAPSTGASSPAASASPSARAVASTGGVSA